MDSEGNTGKAQRYNLRDKSQIKKPARYMASAMFIDSRNPDLFQEAIASDDAKHWKEAMDDEMSSLIENKTWELVNLPPGRRVIINRWVLRVKTNPDRSVDRYKA